MYQSDRLEVWNLASGVPTYIGSQQVFNVVGRLKCQESVFRLSYCINGGPERPVFFIRECQNDGRLVRAGDFNIDTINIAELKPVNHLRFTIYDNAHREQREEIVFPCHAYEEKVPRLRLNFQDVDYPQQAGQVVDGKWRIGSDERGVSCLELRPEDSGYDRIILFGRDNWTSGYQIFSKLCITEWTGKIHNVGLLFKWNPHHTGDGTCLPTQWSTGLGYYFSHCAGLRIRFGVNVHFDSQGRKVGDYILQESVLSPWRRWVSRIGNRFIQGGPWLSQLVSGCPYYFRLLVHPKQYALTVWREGRKEPLPQLVVRAPLDKLGEGCVGIIAHHCALRLYEFNVDPAE